MDLLGAAIHDLGSLPAKICLTTVRTGQPHRARMPPPLTLTDAQRRFLDSSRVAHLATVSAKGDPHLVPVCFALHETSAYITVDEKPKRTDIPLKRLRNIAHNPSVAITVDRWDEDWTRLAWVMLHGTASILTGGDEHDAAQSRLRDRYPQYLSMDLAPLPVIAVRLTRVRSWGNLEPEE